MQRLAGPFKLARSVLTSRGVSTATALQELRNKDDDIDRYLYLRELQRCGNTLLSGHGLALLHDGDGLLWDVTQWEILVSFSYVDLCKILCRRLQEGQFYSLLIQHTEEVLPYVYTPTVGEACQRYHHLPLVPKGLYLRATQSERFLDILRAWPQQDVRCCRHACY